VAALLATMPADTAATCRSEILTALRQLSPDALQTVLDDRHRHAVHKRAVERAEVLLGVALGAATAAEHASRVAVGV
jgi:hypothetical protein